MISLKLYTSHIQRIHYGKRSDLAMHILNFAQRLPWLAIGMTAIALLTATYRYGTRTIMLAATPYRTGSAP